MRQLTVFGSVNVDHVIQIPDFAKPGETLKGENYRLVYGGKGANQGVAVARLKNETLNTNFLGCVGGDAIGLEIKNAMAKDGIDTQGLEIVPEVATGIALIQVTNSGENSIVLASGANDYVNDDFVEAHQEALKTADYLLMQLETPISAVVKAAHIAKNAGAKVVLNPAPAQALPEEIFSSIDIITPNETEAEILTGIAVTDEESAKKAAEVFHQKGIEIVLITLGKRGVFMSDGQQSQIVKGFVVNATDTTAAGDTFNAGFLVKLMEGATLEDAIQFGQAAAAISVTRPGAQPSIPTRQEVIEFLANH